MPTEGQKLLGRQLLRVQLGLEPTDWKPMGTIGPGVAEIRIRTSRFHRVFYVSRFAEAVYVLHAFEKKSQRTDRRDLELGTTRYGQLLAKRRERGGQGER